MSNIVPTDAPSVFSDLDVLTTLEKNALVRPNNPPPGIAGFLFDIQVEDAADIQSDITDHYVEDNVALQDQIALRPEMVTVRGLIGELVQASEQVDTITEQIDALPINEQLVPEYTLEQEVEFDQEEQDATEATDALTDNVSLEGYFAARNPNSGNKQSQAFAYFYGLWKGRQLFTVDTPWGFFTDMAILSLRASQDASTKYVSDFTITFKKIRFAKEVVVSSGQLAGRCAQQSSDQTKNGVAGKEDVTPERNQSWLHQLTQ